MYNLIRYGSGFGPSHLYWSIYPGNKLEPSPLSKFECLYLEVDGGYIAYNPIQFTSSQSHGLFLRNSQGDYILSGLSRGETLVGYADSIKINEMPSINGVLVKANLVSESELHSLLRSKGPMDWEANVSIENNRYEIEVRRRQWKPMFN